MGRCVLNLEFIEDALEVAGCFCFFFFLLLLLIPLSIHTHESLPPSNLSLFPLLLLLRLQQPPRLPHQRPYLCFLSTIDIPPFLRLQIREEIFDGW